MTLYRDSAETKVAIIQQWVSGWCSNKGRFDLIFNSSNFFIKKCNK